jgi:hypothetical protein
MPDTDTDISPQDRDLMIRTVIGEAGNQPPDGQAAVAHVILNRVNDGGYGGSTPSDVVLAPNQFEPWQTRASELSNISPTSGAYQSAANIVDGVISGNIKDPTDGATHFLNADVVRQRRGGSLPSWASGGGQKIGDHTFYGGQQAGQDAINSSLGIKSDPISTALGYTDQPNGSLFSGAGLTTPTPANQPAPGALFGAAGLKVPAIPAQATQGSIFDKAGLTTPQAEPNVYRTPSGALHITIQKDNLPIPVPGTPEFAQQEQQGAPSPEPGILQRLREATDPVSIAESLGHAVNQSALEANTAAQSLKQSGQADLKNANLFPSFPSADPSTWTGGGLLKTAAGATGQFMAPLTGAVNALVADPVTQATGNPEIGERAAFLASALLPVPKGASAVKNQLAPARAIDTIVKTVGPENVPSLVGALRNNPRLTPMDVNDSLRQLGQGLISDPAYPSVQKPLMDMVKGRAATAPQAINSAYTAAMGASPDTVRMVQGLKDKAAEVGKQMIQPALENAKPIAVKSLTGPIDRAIGSPEAIAGETPKIPLNPTQIRLLNLRKQITSGEMAPLDERAGLGVGPVKEALKAGGMSAERTADFTEARRLLNSARRGFTSEDDLIAGLKKLADKQKIVGPIDSALKMIQKGPTEYRGADFVHGVQSRLREEAESLSKSSSGAERTMGKDLFDARAKLVGKVDEASGGTYKPALAKYREAKQIDDAWQSGFDTLKNRSGVNGLEDRPEALREWMKTATPEQIVAKRLGTRSDIDQKIRGVKNQSLAGTSITKIEYNQEKLKDLFGEKEGSRLVRAMDDAAREAETNAKLVAGSKTAETLAGQKALEVRKVGKGNPLGYLQYAAPLAAEGLNFEVGHGVLPPGVATAGILAAKGLHLGAQKLGQMRDVAKNNAFARALSALGPEREQVINRLMSHPAVVRQLNKPSNALSVP